jgi:hypothetical protein
MTKPLRNAHFRIFLALAVLLPTFIVLSVIAAQHAR